MIRIGIICPSEIAFRRFMPALVQIKDFKFIGLSFNKNRVKAQKFIDLYGGKIFGGYDEIISSNEIDAIYIPLPPALHYLWAKKALEHGKHVLLEKPATLSVSDTQNLVEAADVKGLALHENYMFVYHKQMKEISEIIKSGEIGEARLYRIFFGFPRRPLEDFRYNKELGGGALYDCGGYTLKCARIMLGDSAQVLAATSNYVDGFEVDLYGTATLQNRNGDTAHISFGMDHDYRCELDVWASNGSLYTNRIMTAPVDFVPEVVIKKGADIEVRKLSPDDTFLKSILRFSDCIADANARKENYQIILEQGRLVSDFQKHSKIYCGAEEL